MSSTHTSNKNEWKQYFDQRKLLLLRALDAAKQEDWKTLFKTIEEKDLLQQQCDPALLNAVLTEDQKQEINEQAKVEDSTIALVKKALAKIKKSLPHKRVMPSFYDNSQSVFFDKNF